MGAINEVRLDSTKKSTHVEEYGLHDSLHEEGVYGVEVKEVRRDIVAMHEV